MDITGFCLGAAAISALAFAVIMAESSWLRLAAGRRATVRERCQGAIAFLWWEGKARASIAGPAVLCVPGGS